ncbi:unnamed protein product (macronuclear) [Paramecium tetraurelia]|uniref:non-specific serine/threonine protein kinase n=1 Tax=Paramecium tetraurelia TaxID=5888 RepID=A0EC68_PARTE|nr:uncharacterized protein GSPATT00025621001 [Paramecium tetraurelia]CAK92885.1 unnamed protein product [Paramecium tetraurelia]|eukprot:XP_001460282.1 hypothetical protein (macronuclear) [Paramecium tetraurelia strain d4-2]
MDKYKRIKMIGKGNFGDVWLVEDNKGQKFALKLIDLQFQSVDPTNEVTLLKVLKHPNIIKYYGSFIQNDQLCILMEFAENYDLQIYTKNNPANILNWFTQLCQAVQYLHSMNIVHKDIKMKNVFLTKDGIIKLGDFSISKNLDASLNLAQLGTPYYLSPEICESKPSNTKSDIWGLGCLLYELCSKQKPFQGESLPEVFKNIITSETPKLPEGFPTVYQDIINQCLQKNPQERPEISLILEIPEIKKERIKFSQLYKQRLIGMLKQIDNTQSEQVQTNIKQMQKPIFTPQNKSQSLLFQKLFSEQIQSNIKKPMTKKIISIDTDLIEKEGQQQQQNETPTQFAKQLFNPKTPTSPNRNLLLADFLKKKLGEQKFQDVRQILEESQNPIQLLDQKEIMVNLMGEENLECVKIFKILISNCTTLPSNHFRQMNNYQFLRDKVGSQPDLDQDIKTYNF